MKRSHIAAGLCTVRACGFRLLKAFCVLRGLDLFLRFRGRSGVSGICVAVERMRGSCVGGSHANP